VFDVAWPLFVFLKFRALRWLSRNRVHRSRHCLSET
jgi:hypothetical protein